jgi:DNA-binding NarL/FixJ family response regulator
MSSDTIAIVVCIAFILLIISVVYVSVRAPSAPPPELPPQLSTRLQLRVEKPTPTLKQKSDSALPLTEREREIAKLVARGLRNKEIALHLNLSIHTVQNHLKNMYAKLEISSRTELVWKIQHLGDDEIETPNVDD